MKTKTLKFFLLSFLAVASLSCSSRKGGSGPGTVTDAEINAEAEKAYAEVKAKSKISTNAKWTAMVQRVSDRIAKASGEPFKWEVILIENPEPNAWCMPGGKMAVYTGIMPILETEGALAAVMGHEVAHATQRHGREGYARAVRGNFIGLGIAAVAIGVGQFFCKSQTCKIATALGGAAGGLAVAFFDRKFSREDETESDKVGQIFMAKAGYDPAEASRVWERMAKAGGKGGPEWMSTHPANSRRRENLKAWLPEANTAYQSSPQKFGTGERI